RATEQRKVIPAGDLSGLAELLKSKQPAIRKPAVELAGLWKVTAVVPQLKQIASAKETPAALRRSALKSLVILNPKETQELLKSLAGEDQPFALRSVAITVLTPHDPHTAANLA